MILSQIQDLLVKQEGLRLKPYRCTEGKLTIGVGRNLDDKGLSEKEALYLLNEDIKECYSDLLHYFFPNQFDNFPFPIQHALISMRFQLGHNGLKGFKKMIFAFKDYDYPEAIKQMKDSRWYKQTTNRAEELINMVKGCINEDT